MWAFGLLTGLVASGYGVMFTVLDDYRDLYGIQGTQLGIVLATGFFSSFVAQAFLAPIADRGHARSMVIIGLLGGVVGVLGMAFSKTFVALLVSRLIMGLGAGVATPAIRRIIILTAPEQIGRNMGILLSADVAGFAAGPAISAVLVGPFGLWSPFVLIAIATLACLPMVLRLHVDEAVEPPDERFAFDLFRSRTFAAAACLGCAVFIMIGIFDALWVLVLDDLHASTLIKNLGITLFALPLVLFGSIGGRFSQRNGPYRVGTIGLLVGAVAVFLYGRMPTGMTMLAVGMVHSLNDGLTVTSNGVAVGMAVPPERQAGAQGLLGGVQTLVAGLMAASAGWLYEHYGRAVAYSTASALMVTLIVSAVLLVGKDWGTRG